MKVDTNSDPASNPSPSSRTRCPQLHKSATATTSPVISASYNLPILGSNDKMESGDTIKSSITKKYLVPIDRRDLIICSQEDSSINFYVDSRTVFMASPILQLQTVHYGYLRTELGTKRAVVTLDEPTRSINTMLRLIYTRATKPRVYSSEALDHLLELCQRYGMAPASHSLFSTTPPG